MCSGIIPVKITTLIRAFLKRQKICHNKKLNADKSKRNVGVEEYKIWDEEEFEKFSSVIDDPIYKTFFTYLFYTGRRKGEVMALSPRDIHKNSALYNKSITTKGEDRNNSWEITTTKTGKGGEIIICPKVTEALEKYKKTPYYNESNKFLFGGDRPLPMSTVTKRFDYYKKLAGVSDIRIHDLRHSFVSMVIHKGAKPTAVANLISDRLEQVLKTYAHLYPDDVESIIGSIK